MLLIICAAFRLAQLVKNRATVIPHQTWAAIRESACVPPTILGIAKLKRARAY